MKKLFLLLVLSLACVATWADDIRRMDIGGTMFNDFTTDMPDMMGDGGSVSFKASTKTVTLKNADLEYVSFWGDCTFELIGNNSIQSRNTANLALLAYGNVTFKGTGSLYLYAKSTAACEFLYDYDFGDNLGIVEGTPGSDISHTVRIAPCYKIWVNGERLTTAKPQMYNATRDELLLDYRYARLTSLRIETGTTKIVLDADCDIENLKGYGIEFTGNLTIGGKGSLSVKGNPQAFSSDQVTFADRFQVTEGSLTGTKAVIGKNVEQYQVWVSGEQLHSEHNYVLNPTGGSVGYYPDENKIVLRDYSGSYIYAPKGIKIELVGRNILTGDPEEEYAVYADEGSIDFYGTGRLTAHGDNHAFGRWLMANINLHDGISYVKGDVEAEDIVIAANVVDDSRNVYSHPFTVGPASCVQFSLGNIVGSAMEDGFSFASTQLVLGKQLPTNVYAIEPWTFPIQNANGRTNFRLLTTDEWSYLLFARPNAFMLRAMATVCSVQGMLLLPDDFKAPAGIDILPSATLGNKSDYSDNFFNPDQWAQLEAMGVVFLPAAGSSGVTTNGGWYATPYGGWFTFYKAGNCTVGEDTAPHQFTIRLVQDCEYVAPVAAKKGDVNGDGAVTIKDVVNVLEIMAEQ